MAKRKTREDVSPLLNGTGTSVTQNMEKAEVLNTLLSTVFSIKTSFQDSQVPDTEGKAWSKQELFRIRIENT